MRRATRLAVLALTLCASCAAAQVAPPSAAAGIDWTKRSSNPFASGRIDSWYHLLRDETGLKRAIIMRSFDVPAAELPGDYASIIYAQDFDCAARTTRIGLMYRYAGQRGTGRLLYNEDSFSVPRPFDDASEEERFFRQRLCP